MRVWERDEGDGIWRLVVVSEIQSAALRRLALLATLPLMFLWWVVGVAWSSALAVLAAAIAPFYYTYKTFPVELFRSFALRWNTPKPRSALTPSEDSP